MDKLREAAEKMIQICTAPGLGQKERDIGVQWLREALAESPQWIPISKRLPEEHQDALMLCNGKIYQASLEWERPGFEDTFQAFQYFMTADDEELLWDDVTHWMPLPALPQSAI